MFVRGLSVWFLLSCFSLAVLGAQSPQRVNTSAYENQLEKIQNDEKQPQAMRSLAGKIIYSLREANFGAAVNQLESLAMLDRKSKVAFEARMILCDLALHVFTNLKSAQQQFQFMTDDQKVQAMDHWLDHSNAFTGEKNPQKRRGFAIFLSSVGDWGERNGYKKTDKIRFLVAGLLPNQGNTRESAAVYERVAQTGQSTEDQTKALFELARNHLESDRFTEALAALRRMVAPNALEQRFEWVIKVCQKNPDSPTALRELQQEKIFCPAGPLRSRFDIAIAEIYLREEEYEEAEKSLTAADSQYRYQDVLNDLKKRYESENRQREQLQKQIADRLKTIAQESLKK